MQHSDPQRDQKHGRRSKGATGKKKPSGRSSSVATARTRAHARGRETYSGQDARASMSAGEGGQGAAGATPQTGNAPRARAVPPAGWKQRFLELVVELDGVDAAADAVGVATSTVYRERERDPAFGVRCVEAVVFRRVLRGDRKAVYRKGEEVGSEYVFDSALQLAWLKVHDPARWNLAPGDAGEAGEAQRSAADKFAGALRGVLAGMTASVPEFAEGGKVAA